MSSEERDLVGVARGASTILDISADFEQAGFRGQFGSEEGAKIRCFTCKRVVAAGSVTVDQLRRLEGASDPADMLAVVALTCPECDTRGTLMLNYGPVATAEDDAILRKLESPPPPDPESTSV